MSKILIIGNGPSAIEKEYGDIIDSDNWDVVMRFNRWNKSDTGEIHDDYSKYIGTRCDYWMINDLRIDVGIERRKDYKWVLIYCPKFTPMEYENYINKNIIDFKPKWPSTGVIGIYFATLHFDEVYLHGFDTYDDKYDNLHYFENKPNKYKNSSEKDHEPVKEKKFIKLIKEKYNVKELTNKLGK